MDRAQSSSHRMIAVYPDMESARGALSALESSGVDAVDIRVVGDTADAAAGRRDVTTRDRNLTRHVGRRAILGSLAGLVVGVVLGLVAGALLPGPAFVYVMALVILGVAWGSLLGGYATLQATEEWELTFERQPGEVAVAVEAKAESTLETATEALRKAGAIRVERR